MGSIRAFKGLMFVLVSAVLAASTSSAAAMHVRSGTATGQLGDHAVNGRVSFGSPDPEVGDVTLWTARADGTHMRRLTHEPSFFSDWAPSGRRIAYDFVDSSGEHIATIRPDGRDRRQITFTAGFQEVPRWSPNGRWITFDGSPVTPDDPSFSRISIWLMRADGSHQRRITRGAFDVEPVFSADGGKIAFGRITGSNANGEQLEAIDVVNVNGHHLRRVVPSRAGLEHPDWSPDGRWISFNIEPQTAARTAGAIFAVHPNGRGLHVVRSATRRLLFFKAVWSPDGRKMLSGCHDLRDDLDKLCVIDIATGRVHVTLSRKPFPVNFPAWGPRPIR